MRRGKRFYRIRKLWRRITPLWKYAEMTIRPVEWVFIHHTALPMPPEYSKWLKIEFDRFRSPKERRHARRNAKRLERQMMRRLEEIAINRDFDGISYTDVVFESGRVYNGRGFKKIGAHTLGYNERGYGISAAGDFSRVAPTQRMLHGMAGTIAKGVRWRRIKKVFNTAPHSAVKATACPGAELKAEIPTIVHMVKRKIAA